MGAATAAVIGGAAISAGGSYLSAREANKGKGGGGGAPTSSWLMLGKPAYDPATGQYSTTEFAESPIAQGTFDNNKKRLITHYTGQQEKQTGAWNQQFDRAMAGGTGAQRAIKDFSEGQALWMMGPASGNLWRESGNIDKGYENNAQSALARGAEHADVTAHGLYGIGANQAATARQMQDMGIEAMGRDYQGLAADRLSLLREQAAPQEERAQNAMAQKLFSMGQLGTEGGARGIEAFGEGLGRADLERQLQSQTMADDMLTRERAFGGSLMNTADSMARTSGGMLSSGLDAASQGVAMNQGRYDLAQNAADWRQRRAASRMTQAQQLFGFAGGIQDTQMQRATLAQQNTSAINSEMRENIALATNVANAGQGGNASTSGSGGGSAAGAALSGFGQSVMSNPEAFTSMFGGTQGGGGAGTGGVTLSNSNAWADNFNFG